jgi:hypothetical protein
VNARIGLILIFVVATCGPADPPDLSTPMHEPNPQQLRDAARAFHALRDGYLEWYHEAHPVQASELGIERHDGQWPGMDHVSIQRRIDALLDWEVQLGRIPLRLLRDGDRFDRALIENAVRSDLMDLEEVRLWVADPVQYTDLIARGLWTLVERPGPGVDLEALGARVAGAPAILAAARSNLRSPPRIWTELAIEQTRGLLAWLETDLTGLLAARAVPEPALEPGRMELATALRDHLEWLETRLLPTSTGDYQLGRYLFVRKLLYEEHVNLSVEELTRQNEAAIADYQARLEQVAAEIDATRSARAVVDSLMGLRPDPEELVPLAREAMLVARARSVDADLVSIPDEALPVVRAAPPYSPWELTALRTPGPFQASPGAAFFEVRGVDPEWSDEQRAQHLSYFNAAALPGIAAHETFPGRYVQYLHSHQVESELRRTLLAGRARTLTGGWPLYAVQQLIEGGHVVNDPAVRLSHYRRALQQHARWHAALHLHTMGATVDEVVDRFMEISYLGEFPARREVRLATRDPLYLAPALGRLQIEALRLAYREYLEERRQEFTARGFHDRLLRLGLPPTLATEALMPPPPPEPRAHRQRAWP